MTKIMLSKDCIVINVDDARKLVDAFLSMQTRECSTFNKRDLKRIHDAGVFMVLNSLRDNVRDYDSMYEHFLGVGGD